MAASIVRVAMESYGFLVLFAVLGLSLSKTNSPELEIHPAGLIKQGTNVTITCSVRKAKVLDFVRIVRQIDGVPYEISTNKLLKQPYRLSGRYTNIKYETTNGVTESKLFIKNIQGRDGGNIGCLLLPQDVGAFEELIVHVPPKSVKLSYLLEDGTEVEASPGQNLQMRHGVDSAIICRIFVDGSDDRPTIGITFDGKDMTSSFQRDFSADNGADPDGFLALNHNESLTYRSDNPNKDYNGKQVVCSATMKHFPPVIAKAKLEILYPPGLVCKQRLYALPGTPDVKIACKGKMHPAPVRTTWSFGKGDNKTSLKMGEQEGAFNSKLEDLGDDEYEMSLTIKEVAEEHFMNYHLQVTNGIGESKSLVRLVKEEADNAGQDGGIRDGTNPPINAEEMVVHGSANQPTVSLVSMLAACVFVVGIRML